MGNSGYRSLWLSGRTVARRWVAFAAAFVVAASMLTVAGGADRAEAASASDFDAGMIISDAKFYDGTALGAGDVQSFLNSRVATCRATTGPTCIKSYRTDIPERAERAGRCEAIAASSNRSAAEVIYTVGRACGISQKVLLVLLEKEQGLVTSTAPTEIKYRIATGYGCPDTAACDTNFYGFFNQVYSAAAQFKSYAATPSSWRYRAGTTVAVGYHPNASCGSTDVTIRNQATAGLYIYTPYVPNSASLGNLYWSGDECSSYGNRNFWRLFTDWFGSSTDGLSPVGGMDATQNDNGQIQVNGWAIDPDVTAPISVHVYVDGKGAAVTTANASRPDVGAAYPRYGNNHGINTAITVGTGRHNVCAYGIDATGEANSLLGCQAISVVSKSPYGGMNAFSAQYSGTVTVNGWTIDPETSAPIDVDVTVDGVAVGTTTANADRPDVGRAYPQAGPLHGINYTVQANPGARRVCATAVNTGKGANISLGCQTVNVDSLAPFGGMDVTTAHRSITVNGWTIDPETTAPIAVHIYANGKAVGETTASANRPDVGRVHPNFGAAHGINASIAMPPGVQNVCAYGINVGRGENSLLGCQTVTVVDLSPFGGMDAVVEGNDIRVRGWTIDPDTTGAIAVHVYSNGRPVAVTTANASRPDVGQVYPKFGALHGIDTRFEAAKGSQNVCAYGINVAQGSNSLLGCQTVTVP